MNRKSKEDILNDVAKDITSKGYVKHTCAQNAMQAYADQEMALFTEWKDSLYRVYGYSPDGAMYYDKEHDPDVAWKKRAIYTTKQLITKYKEENP